MTRTRPRIRPLAAATALAAAAIALTACVPEPDGTATPSATEPGSPSASSSPDATTPAEDRPQATEITLPATCDDLYSTQMRATLDAQLPPLNDAGVTLYSTQLVPALELLESGVPTVRCTWGVPGEAGLSTNVTVLAIDDVPRLQDLLAMNGFGCTDASGGILCTIETETLDLDSTLVHRGESHFLRGNGWVATSWIDGMPDGYTEDIAATLWG